MKKGVIFQEAYQAYIKDRGISDFSELAFERLLKVYPGLLVTSSDGFVDLAEGDTLAFIASEGTSTSPETFIRELKNLYFHQGHWKNIFTKAIQEIAESESTQLEILTYMVYAAAASTGSIVKNILLSDYKPQNFSLLNIKSLEEIDPTREFFSAQEKQKILQIAEELHLLQNPEIKNKVYQLFS